MTRKYKKKTIEQKELEKRDKNWANKVKLNFNNKCALCLETKYLNSHHIIPREIKEFRFWEINGIALCVKCHKFGLNSAHRNPLWFFMQLDKFYKLKIDYLKKKYAEYLGGHFNVKRRINTN